MSSSPSSGPLATQLADAANEYGQAFRDHQPIDGEAVAVLHARLLEFAAQQPARVRAAFLHAAAILRSLIHPDEADRQHPDRAMYADKLQVAIYDAWFAVAPVDVISEPGE